jgi:TolB-like protein/Tfp pilus assembly protein PilF
VTEASHAVFLSYASQDTEAAQKICEALRAAGIEVFFDQSELRGGDLWDQKIRREIHDCALFIPVISANTASRHEGYFRLEWDLADQRSHMMARSRVFVVPVCLDATTEAVADVPESFRRAQWTRLPAGETPPAFVDRVRRLLSPEPSHGPTTTVSPAGPISAMPPTRAWLPASWRSQPALLAIVAAVALGGLAYLAINRFWVLKHAASQSTPPPAPASVAPAAFTPPPHSIAVLPFVNMSGDKEQEYFSDGLSEELLNSLSRINELQVAARTSSFYFKGEHADLATIAHKLNVASVLEGSVRRSGHTVRVTAQLNNAATGYHLWSQTYDRDLNDVLAVQTEIANAVAGALKVTLLGDIAAKIEVGGTRNPDALDAYLRGLQAHYRHHDAKDLQTGIEYFAQAIRLDPNYALAFAGRSMALSVYANYYARGPGIRVGFDEANIDARKAISLAPELAEGHLALAVLFEDTLDFKSSSGEFERALALAPGNARVVRNYGEFTVAMGRVDAGIAAVRRAAVLDPLNPLSHEYLGTVLFNARRYDKAVAAYEVERSLDPDQPFAYPGRGFSYYMLGNFQAARASCEIKPDDIDSRVCLAVTYDKLGRHADAEAELAKYKAAQGDSGAYQYAMMYAQWGNRAKALEWLDTAMRVRDSGLLWLKTDPLMDPLRKEPRFQAIERELKFPD